MTEKTAGKALIAMSGGVDSSVAAYLMINKGYECMGANMKLYQNDLIEVSKTNTCCSVDDTQDARSVADKLGMPFYVLNFKDNFLECVVEPFVCAYQKGQTPNPCIECNRHLKFGRLLQKARELGCDVVVTGHYARTYYDEKRKRYILCKAVDASKDQSYVLYSMTQAELAHIRFPLGDYTKEYARQMAEEAGLVNARKHDSQDICFVPDGDYAGFIEKFLSDGAAEVPAEGNFVDMEGKVLGKHKGIWHYTIGQRKGLGIAFGEPIYVVAIHPETKEVVLGPNEALFRDTLVAQNFNWLSIEKPEGELSCKAKIRYKHQEAEATAVCLLDGKVRVTFKEPQRAITAGQAVVLYNEEGEVLGGGTIVS